MNEFQRSAYATAIDKADSNTRKGSRLQAPLAIRKCDCGPEEHEAWRASGNNGKCAHDSANQNDRKGYIFVPDDPQDRPCGNCGANVRGMAMECKACYVPDGNGVMRHPTVDVVHSTTGHYEVCENHIPANGKPSKVTKDLWAYEDWKAAGKPAHPVFNKPAWLAERYQDGLALPLALTDYCYKCKQTRSCSCRKASGPIERPTVPVVLFSDAPRMPEPKYYRVADATLPISETNSVPCWH